jgi:hypothetical protein
MNGGPFVESAADQNPESLRPAARHGGQHACYAHHCDASDADRAALIDRLHARDDAAWLAELLMDLEGEEGEASPRSAGRLHPGRTWLMNRTTAWLQFDRVGVGLPGVVGLSRTHDWSTA